LCFIIAQVSSLKSLFTVEKMTIAKFRHFTVSEYARMTAAFLLLIGMGLACDFATRKYDYRLLNMFGDALIIAGALGIAFELFATRLLIEKVAESIAGKLSGRGLPEESRGLIRELVETSIVREDYRKTYRFSEIDQYGDVSIEITVRYVARNYSGTIREFVPSIQEEVFYSPEFKALEYGTEKESRVLGADQIRELTKVDSETKVKSLFAPEILLESWHTNKNAQCSVIIKYSIKMKDEYSDVTSFGGATEGATIELEYIPASLDFVSGMDRKMIHVDGSSVWQFKRPFINGQHVRVWWFKKSARDVGA
jgi:hypothetical protein